MPPEEKASLEQFILNSDARIQSYFDVTKRADGHLDSFSFELIFLVGRKR
jgi:hypothetical protein